MEQLTRSTNIGDKSVKIHLSLLSFTTSFRRNKNIYLLHLLLPNFYSEFCGSSKYQNKSNAKGVAFGLSDQEFGPCGLIR